MNFNQIRIDSIGSAKNAKVDNLYAGFFDQSPKVYDFDVTETMSPMLTASVLRSSHMGKMATPSSLMSRMGIGTASTAIMGSKARPSTAVRGVGYTSDASRTFDVQGNQAKKTIIFDGKKEQSADEKYRSLEKKIQDILEQSILMSTTTANSSTAVLNFPDSNFLAAATSSSSSLKPDLRGALNKAKEASSLDRKLLQLRDQGTGNYVHNFDLTFSVLFNLANLYAINDMHVEALNTYNLITKNKMFANANRLKINMGNIYVKLGMFPKAIKMYRMALDQVPINQKELRLRVTHNIGILFVRMGQYSDAATSFEFIMSERGDIRAGMHLILCYYALGDVEKMKRAFQMLLDVATEFDEDDKLNAISVS